MDRRERNHKWWHQFDEARMQAIILAEDGEGDEVEVRIPVVYEVCGTCDGKGTHVNPSIDSHGLSREDFDEDPDFRENYFSGMYDVQCNECRGKRVAITIDDVHATPDQLTAYYDRISMLAEIDAENDHQRRYQY